MPQAGRHRLAAPRNGAAGESLAFTNDTPGNRFMEAVLAHLKAHKGQLFTPYEIAAIVGHKGIKRSSAITTISIRWTYAGATALGDDDEWLHVHRTRLPNRRFAYKYMADKREPVRTVPPSTFNRSKRDQRDLAIAKHMFRTGAPPKGEVATKGALQKLSDLQIAAQQGSPVNGAAKVSDLLPGTPVTVVEVEPDPILDAPADVTVVEANGHDITPEVEQLVDDTIEAVRQYRGGFKMGDLVEVIGFTRKGEAIVRDSNFELYRITALEV